MKALAERDTALDVLRALTMFVMVFVNDFWTVDRVPHWLEHAAAGEDFMGLADVVFPLFLFVVGMSIPLAVERRGASLRTLGHILSRTLALLVMGAMIVNSEAGSSGAPIGVYWIAMVAGFILIWNVRTRWFWQLAGAMVLAALAFTFRDARGGLFAVRWWGILGMIGWSYLFGAVAYLFTRSRLPRLLAVFGGAVALCVLGTPMRGGEALWAFQPLDALHLGNGATAALVMGGVVFSVVAGRLSTVWKLLLAGGFAALGVAAREVWILSKIGGTPTWVFFVFAIAVAAYTLLIHARARWFAVLKPAGTATLTCYLVPYPVYAASSLTGWRLPDVLTHGGMGIVNCLCFALFVIGVTWALGKIGIKLKI